MNTRDTFVVVCGHAQSGKAFDSLAVTFSAEVEQGVRLPSCFNSQTVNNRPFHALSNAACLRVLCFVLVTSLLNMAFTQSEGLPQVPTWKKAATCLTGKTPC